MKGIPAAIKLNLHALKLEVRLCATWRVFKSSSIQNVESFFAEIYWNLIGSFDAILIT